MILSSITNEADTPRHSRAVAAPVPWRPAVPSDRFQLRRFFGLYTVPLLAMALRCGPSHAGTVSYFLVAAYALAGVRQALVSLWMCWVFNMLNHGLVSPPASATFLRHGIVFAAFLSVVIYSRRSAYRTTGFLILGTAVLCAFLIAHSFVFSQQPDVSVLKAVSFSMTVLATGIGWGSLIPAERRETERFVFGSLATIAVVSLPLVPLPVGYFRNGVGFQGVMVHPQNFGPSMAVLATALLAMALAGRKVRLWHVVALLAGLVGVYLSQSRVAAVALLAGLTLGVAGELMRKVVARVRLGDTVRNSRLILGSLLTMTVAIVASPWLVPALTKFIEKGSKTETAYEAALKSRGGKLALMYENIARHPEAGVGFGINTETDYFGIARDPIFGLPVMATVEKGVMPVAVVEETGIVGALVTFPWLLLIVLRATQGGVVTSSVCWAVLVTNVAEACLFSPGGQGMFQIILVMWAATALPCTLTVGVSRNVRTGTAQARIAA